VGAFTYQWQRAIDANQDGSIQEGEWTNIAGASATTYALSDADVGRLVRVTVSYVDGDGKA
jgi:hypothetical protein